MARDNSQEVTELFLEASLKNSRKPVEKATGYCLFCQEPLPQGQKFCDIDCSIDFEKEKHMKTGRRQCQI